MSRLREMCEAIGILPQEEQDQIRRRIEAGEGWVGYAGERYIRVRGRVFAEKLVLLYLDQKGLVP